MRGAIAILSAALAASGTGCMAGMMAGHGAEMASHAPLAQGGAGEMQMHCPMAVPGTRLAVADTPDGESVMFTTSSDRAEDLRARVRAMADMHNRHQEGGGMEGMHGGGMEHGGMMHGMEGMHGGMGAPGGADQMMMPPPSRAAAEDVEGGARLVVTPNDPADLEKLRSAIRMHAQHMQESGKCGMEHGGGM